MKKIQRSLELWFSKNAERKLPRQANRRRLAALKKRAFHQWVKYNKAKQKDFAKTHNVNLPISSDLVPILLPDRICLRTNRVAVLEVINLLERTVFIDRHPAMIYFDHVSFLEPAATLVLLASIFRCKNLTQFRNNKSIIGNYPSDLKVLLQLEEMGFFRLLNVEVPAVDNAVALDPSRPIFLSFQTMTRVVGHEATSICDLVTIGAFEMDPKTKRRMVAALKEAMGNAQEHAYSIPTGRPIPVMKNRWWIAGHLDREHREMMLILFDQGVGIPSTLNPDLIGRLRALVKFSARPTDGELIAAATEVYRTSTGQGGRGRGFRDMKRFVDSCDDGELRVLSNRGAYTYMNGGPLTEEWDDSICGTLVEWRVRHSSVAEIDDD